MIQKLQNRSYIYVRSFVNSILVPGQELHFLGSLPWMLFFICCFSSDHQTFTVSFMIRHVMGRIFMTSIEYMKYVEFDSHGYRTWAPLWLESDTRTIWPRRQFIWWCLKLSNQHITIHIYFGNRHCYFCYR